jgi:hypothetical protein
MPYHKYIRFVTVVQATVSFKDSGTSTDPFTGPLPVACSTPVKLPPSKRPWLQQQEEEEEEDCLEGSAILASEGLDATFHPEDSVTTLPESTFMS